MQHNPKWRQLLLALALAVGLMGCNDDDNYSGSPWQGDNALVGYWRLSDVPINRVAVGSPSTMGWEVGLLLYSNGTATMTEMRQANTQTYGGVWSSRGHEMSLTCGAYVWVGDYRVTSSRFTLSDVANYDNQGARASFVFLRQ